MNEAVKQFYKDPNWESVEEDIIDYINPIADVMTIDTNQPSEVVHAEVKARQIAFEKLMSFVKTTGILRSNYQRPSTTSFR